MNNKLNFLNLPSGLPGDARRHVPFRSIINKHFSIIFVLVFVFYIMFSFRIHAYALAAPQLNPVYNTDIVQIEEYVNGLSSGQMDVFNILLGFYLASQAGAAKYQLEDPYQDQSGVLNWLKSCGIKFYNDFGGWIPTAPEVIGFDEGKLLSVILGAAILADQYEGQTDFVNDVISSSHYFIPFNQGLQIGINQFLASENGLYNWQFNSLSISDLNYFDWNYTALNSVMQSSYNQYFLNFSNPVRFNSTSSVINGLVDTNFTFYYRYNGVVNSPGYFPWNEIFINTSNNIAYLVDSNNNFAPTGIDIFPFKELYVYNNQNVTYLDSGGGYTIKLKNVDISSYSSLSDIVVYLFTYSPFFNISSSSYINFDLSQFISKITYGSSVSSRINWDFTEDLNFYNQTSISYDQVQTDLLLDIKGLLQDLIDINELKEPVFNNFYDTSGQPVSDPATVNVSVNAILPDSGIDIPVNLFSPLTKDGGYISYLWYMTKPLVQYTSDFVQTMVFDGNEDFDITGPGAIVFGVISLGLIGGLVVKCLL